MKLNNYVEMIFLSDVKNLRSRLSGKTPRLSILSTTCILLSACIFSPSEKPQANLKPFAKANEAVVYFYRPKSSLSGLGEKYPPNIYVNQEPVGKLPNGRFKETIIKVLENKTISVHKTLRNRSYANVILQQDLDMSGAARYFVKLNYDRDIAELVVVSEDVAMEEMAKLKSMSSNEEKDDAL